MMGATFSLNVTSAESGSATPPRQASARRFLTVILVASYLIIRRDMGLQFREIARDGIAYGSWRRQDLSEVKNPRIPLHVADVGMHDRRERHQLQAFRKPRVPSQ